ncbi:MAG: HEPN domain-containing protein [Bacteroidales bacterium]|nr:HEPN domain-containing protein [Bacteroidales bacterium]
MNDKITYWVELSDYDIETAEVLLASGKFLYVGFMCHQTIEKIFKAYFIRLKNETPPYSHSLSFIAKKGDFYNEFDKSQREYIDQLEPLNIETRYPLDKDRLLESLTEEKCQELLYKSKELQRWIKLKL